jgi:hypothetical protein
MAQTLVGPQQERLKIPAGEPEKPGWPLGYLMAGLGVALSIIWSGFLVWMAAKGIHGLLS